MLAKPDRFKMLLFIILGYGSYQLMRLNISMIGPTLKEEMGFDNEQLGLIFSAFTIVYALSRIVSGIIADRVNPALFLIIGLAGSAICNSFFSLSGVLANFILFWGMNAFFQSMGAPSCAKILKFSVKKDKMGTYWALWSANAPIGGALSLLFLGYAIPVWGWRTATFISVGVCGLIAFIVYWGIKTLPIKFAENKDSPSANKAFASLNVAYFKEVYTNKQFIRVCIASFCLYSIRVGLFTWFPLIMREVKGADMKLTGIMSAFFEVGSLAGGLLAGWISDRYFNGKRGTVGAFYMGATAVMIAVLWIAPIEHTFFYTLIVIVFGFLAFGPQVLAGVAAVDHASHKTVGLATGSISLFGYLGATFTSYILGPISDHLGWGWGFVLTIVLALIGAYFFGSSYRNAPVHS